MTTTMVLGETVAEHLELNDNVEALETANGIYTVVRIKEGERWLDSMLYGTHETVLYPETCGTIWWFDDVWQQRETVTLDVYANQDTVLTITQQGETTTRDLNGREKITLPLNSCFIDLEVNKPIEIYSYTSK